MLDVLLNCLVLHWYKPMEIYLSSDRLLGLRLFLPGHTMFKEINSAVGGKIYKATGRGDFCKVSTHGEFKFEPKDPVKTPKEFRKKLIGNISNYLHNENTGLFYSGGVDSSLLMNAIFELSRSSECSPNKSCPKNWRGGSSYQTIIKLVEKLIK